MLRKARRTLATYHGHADAVRVLLEHGADPDLRNDNGQTPIAGAAFKGFKAVIVPGGLVLCFSMLCTRSDGGAMQQLSGRDIATFRNIARHPWVFFWQTLKAFRANQGMLLAGAVAYYALLSIVPLLILIVIVLSHVVERQMLLDTLARLLEWLVPGQASALVRELANFLTHRAVIGWVLLVTMLFFSSLAFTVLENAMSVIFVHRVAIRRRHFLLSALLPYSYILFLGIGMLIVTFVSNGLQTMAANSIALAGMHLSLHGVSRAILYLLGLAGEIFVLTSIYLVMPVGRLSLRHALIGAITAALLWEITRHVLVWYFATLSQVSVVYGSLTTSIVVLFSLEMLATLLLFGAQVISEYERFGIERPNQAAKPFHTG